MTAGASEFLLSEVSPGQLISSVKLVSAGGALLDHPSNVD
jgi:DNA-binding NarL/FixJ family response regulator